MLLKQKLEAQLEEMEDERRKLEAEAEELKEENRKAEEALEALRQRSHLQKAGLGLGNAKPC